MHQLIRKGRILTKEEEKEIINHCKKHPDKEGIVECLSTIYICSETSILQTIIKDEMGQIE